MSKDNEHWQVIAKMYDCPECGWVTECYPSCRINKEVSNMLVNEEQCPCFYGGSCPTDYKHKGDK